MLEPMDEDGDDENAVESMMTVEALIEHYRKAKEEKTIQESAYPVPVPARIPIDEDEAVTALRARRQVEFYFTDANLLSNKFLWALHTANAEHWVPLRTIAAFKLMREFQPLGINWLADSLRSSTELEIDAQNEVISVRRRPEMQLLADAAEPDEVHAQNHDRGQDKDKGRP